MDGAKYAISLALITAVAETVIQKIAINMW